MSALASISIFLVVYDTGEGKLCQQILGKGRGGGQE
jgi:hypothetical protein